MPSKKLVGSSDAAELSEANDPQSAELIKFPIPESKLKSKVTRGNLAKIQQKKLLEQVEPMLDEFFKVVRLRARHGDIQALKIIQEICGLSSAKGPSVVAQFYNKNEANASANAKAEAAAVNSEMAGFESLIKRLDSREEQDSKAADFIDVA